MEVIWTKQALRRVREIVDYIARDNYSAAEKWTADLFQKTDRLVNHPRSGRRVPEYNEPELREIITGNYRVVYRIREKKEAVYIQTVWHGRQNPPKTSEEVR